MNEEFFKDLVNSIDDYAIFRLDIGGVVTTWNPGTKRIMGYTAEEIVGKHFSIFYTKEDLRDDRPLNTLLQASTVGKYHEEGWRHRKDGTRFRADVSLTAIYDGKNRIQGFSLVTKDITKSQMIQEKEQKKTELMLQAGNIGTFEWVLDTNEFIWSEELYQILGVDPSVKIKDLSEFEAILFPEDRDRVGKAIEETITMGKIFDEEYQVVHPDKSVHWVHARGRVLRNSDGRPVSMIGALHNIDLQKAHEAVLKIQLKDQNKKLRNAQATLINSAKLSALGEMAAGISHEINTPLASITINAQFLEQALEKMGEKNLSGIAVNIRETGIKIGKIIKGLRAFARDTQGEEMSEAKLLKLIEDVSGLCQTRFKNHGVDLVIDCPYPDLVLHCRPIQMEQVLMNLLSNAFDAVENSALKKVRLKVELTEKELSIKVSDSGPGLTPQNIEKIFQPFFTTKPIGKGTGLGLSISHGIIADHGGRLYLDKDENQTTFVIALPRSLVRPKS